MNPPETGSQKPEPQPRQCPWCSTPASEEATRCSACGASLAQRESLEGVQLPGVTSVDPALQDGQGALARLARAQGKANLIMPLAIFSPELAVGLIAGEAVLGGAKGAIAGLGRPPEEVGEVSEAALSVARRLDAEQAAEAAAGDGSAGSQPGPAAPPPETQPAGDPWSDLPPREFDPWAEPAPDPWAGAQSDPWAGAQSDPWAGAKSDPWATGGGPWSTDLWQDRNAGDRDESSVPDNDRPVSDPTQDSQR